MNIILLGKHHGKSRSVKLGPGSLFAILFLFILLALVLIGAGIFAGSKFYGVSEGALVNPKVISAWETSLNEQKLQLKQVERAGQQKLDALTLMMGDMQARLYRLDALGQRLTEVAKLKSGEFDFNTQPSLGGPIEDDRSDAFSMNQFENGLKNLAQTIADREQQLGIMEQLFDHQQIVDDTFIAGRPIKWGWMSSPYGYRSDPFSGKRAWHGGVDFAGKDGSDIISVAAGVVTWSGERYGYGNLVEINHGNGYATRYAHCKELLVKVGDVVKKGAVIARMGSTGRSTGPHVHYEVLKNGRPENPKKFIYRASRG